MGEIVLFPAVWTAKTPALLTADIKAMIGGRCGPRSPLQMPCHPELQAEHAAWRNAVATFCHEYHFIYSDTSGPSTKETRRVASERFSQRFEEVLAAREAFDTKREALSKLGRRKFREAELLACSRR
jgi:hypothetical protein